jgi:hypothetical protein
MPVRLKRKDCFLLIALFLLLFFPNAFTQEEEMQITEQVPAQESQAEAPYIEQIPAQESQEVQTSEPAQETQATEPTTAQQTEVAPVISGEAPGRVSLDFKDADILSVLRIISLKGNVNIVTTPEVTGTVTIRLTDVS